MRPVARDHMWWEDLLWGFWNGFTCWIVLIAHIVGLWDRFPFYNIERAGNWYDLGFVLGTGSPLFGIFGGGRAASRRK